uniref:Uncharacterized protein n=1 Tax=Oryza glumipatula TaxID=40148 RepID=A0A0E0ATB1_9ORYZ
MAVAGGGSRRRAPSGLGTGGGGLPSPTSHPARQRQGWQRRWPPFLDGGGHGDDDGGSGRRAHSGHGVAGGGGSGQ